uniref:Ricin B-type lectin domain-containing protein n=1 Tax=Caenorhabditis tropicalis TaxID=1561998 RepID=A0A1I7TSK2_9PELO
MLEELELRHKTALFDLCGIPIPESQDSWWGASLISTVLNNIQLILNNVHIRYEDNSTLLGKTFNCGIRIQKMTMQTTNHHWKPGFAEPQKGTNTFKKLELTGFSIYWNSKATMTENIEDSKQLKHILAPECHSSNAFIIEPCNAELRMEKNSSKFPLKAKVPRFKFFMRPDIIALELTRHQMTQLRAVNREWARFERARQHRKWRPLCTIGENAKEWWKFAYNRVLEERRRTNANRTWEFAHERATRFNAYCRAYRKRLLGMIANPNAVQPTVRPDSPGSLTSASNALAVVPASSSNGSSTNSTPTVESTAIMKQIERDAQYTYHELHLFRETVFRKLLKDKEKELGITAAVPDTEEAFESLEPPPLDEIIIEEQPNVPSEPASGGLYGWITGFFGQAQQDEKQEDNKFDFGNVDVGELKDINVKEMEEEILDVLHESWDDSTLLRRDALLAQISLRLEHLTLRFVDSDVYNGIEQQKVLALELSGVSSRWELSPKQHYVSVDVTVSDMSVQRLRSGHPRPKSKLAELSESLLYSTGESTKMLLTIGRDGEDALLSKGPMFSMHYIRRSPRLVVKHMVNCRLRPVNIVYEEDALDGLNTLFSDDPTIFDEILKKTVETVTGSNETDGELVDMKLSTEQVSIIESHVFVNLELPAVRMEVRGRGWSRREMRPSTLWEPGELIACLNADGLNFNIVSKEQYLTNMKLSIVHVEMRDMIENTTYPLFTTSSQSSQMKSISNSCPDLHKGPNETPARSSKSHQSYQNSIISSSVPDESFANTFKPLNLTTITSATSIDNQGLTSAPTPPISGTSGVNNLKPEVMIKITYVDKMHSQFERKYKKRNCSIEIEMDEMEMQMNRRTWAALLEMGGILGEDEHEKSEDATIVSKATSKSSSSFLVGCTLRARNWRVGMPFPKNQTKLGVISLMNTELESTMELNESNSNTLAVKLMVDGMRIDDSTPFFSEMYPERLIMIDEQFESGSNGFGIAPTTKRKLEDSKRIVIDFVKYLGDDPNRECDVSIGFRVPPNQKFYYIHTHRFFCALLDFWMQFNELMNIVTKSKKLKIEESARTKCALDVDIQCATSLMMPLNSTSPDILLWQADSLKLKNTFKTLSALKAEIFDKYSVESDYGYDASVDCLLDYGDMVLSNVRAHEARQVDRLHNQKHLKLVGEKSFQHTAFVFTSPNVFSRRFDLNNKFLRNLDSVFSKNAPDLTIITRISGLKWRMTTQFYVLMRAVIEKNFGEPLIPVADTIPIEILQLPADVKELESRMKYAVLSFRMVFEDVDLNLEVPKKLGENKKALPNGEWQSFANVKLERARISFDSFEDGQSELDLICEKIELVDTTNNGPKNCFPIILQHTDTDKQPRPVTPGTASINSSLMLETHIMMKKDECPVLTLVICNARVILAYDWLDDLKQFLMLYTDFIPKFSDEIPYNLTSSGRQTFSATHGGAIVERNTHPSNEASSSPTFSVKITLRDSDLYLLENSSVKNSFALIASTTAVLNTNDIGGHISANLEIQSMRLSWCSMQHEKQTRNLCSNDFAITISLNVDSVSFAKNLKQNKGIAITPPVSHALEIEVVKMICRLSYKDARALKAIITGYQKNYMEVQKKPLIPIIVPPLPSKPIEIAKYLIHTEHTDLWILDDLQQNSIPLLRLSVANLNLEKAGERIKASFHISMDYFNQRIFGWEPVIEEWRILRFMSNQKDLKRSIELVAETKSTLNINVTEQLIQQSIQWNAKLPAILASFERDDFRNQCTRSSSDHLPYVMKNTTGCEVHFTTAVEDVLSARSEQRKSTTRWITVGRGQEKNFEFPARLLLYSHLEREPPRQLIVRVSGWDEISPVNVDSCGTYFRVIKALRQSLKNARLLISVTMENDGKKVVTLKSSIDVTNHLPHSIAVQTEGANGGEVMNVEPNGVVSVPLEYAHCTLTAYPVGPMPVIEHAGLSWKSVKISGEVCNQTQRLKTRSDSNLNRYYWVCTAIRREYYPEHEFESLPGHSIHLVAPLSLQNLLPIDVEVKIQDNVFAIAASKSLLITTVDITKELAITVTTDRLTSQTPLYINKGSIGEGTLLSTKMIDAKGHLLDMYCHVRLGVAQSISVSLWVPYWIVNKSGLPLIIQQEAVKSEAAGQMEEHEKAKDRHPLMFSFADENCPKACRVRIGNMFIPEKGYRPILSEKFTLTPGVQALKLRVEHKTRETFYYNLGVEVRPGTGRYKDTQVVLLTSRFILQNQSTVALSVCHYDLVEKEKDHVHLAAQSSTTWNENYAARRMLCVRRADVKHWSCPFLIDRIGSFHVTMRDADETPRFIRVEIILTSAVFQITFTNADFYPPPIRIENLTDVPVLYQQESNTPARPHLRTICKSKSVVDYAWDDLYGNKRMVLQVFENRSKSYEIGVPGPAEPLVYENNSYIQLAHSFTLRSGSRPSGYTDEQELVLETMQKGKVMLNKQCRTEDNQLWKLCPDGCIENIGMNHRKRPDSRLVLDVLEKTGGRLMMMERDKKRNKWQRWTWMPDGRLCLIDSPHLMMTSKQTEVAVVEADTLAPKGEDGVAVTQIWKVQRQRPGSGTLGVEFLHSGPTVVIRIIDREFQTRAISEPTIQTAGKLDVLDLSITMRSGIGISVVNGLQEELIYAHFGGIAISARRVDKTYQMTGSVDVIQVDNQLLSSDRWQVLYCQPDAGQNYDDQMPELPAGVPVTGRPALKLEMNCTSMKHYDSFDCFRLKVCDMSVQLDELLLWKVVQMAQSSDASSSVQQRALNLPPNTELERHDPLRTRRWYFGTLDLEMGHVGLSVATVAKSGLPRDLRLLKQQFNLKLISFENASVSLPPFRQYHYFETSSFLLETLQKFYLAELQKQTLSIIVTLDAFGNPLGLVTDLKDSFQGLFIEGDVQRFVAGLGYGLSNSVSKVASSMASGVGALTFDQDHELKRRHNMIRSHSSSSTPLTHLYSGVKGLGVGVLGGATAMFTNVASESRKSGLMKGMVWGVATGVVDTVTKPVQGVFDFVEGTASAMKELAMPATGVRRATAQSRVRIPRLCRNLYHLLPAYNPNLAHAQMELLRINGYSSREQLLDVETCLEHIDAAHVDRIIRQYVLISTKQCYVCRQTNGENSIVIQRIAYKFLKSVVARPPLENTFSSIEVSLDMEDARLRQIHVWCSRIEVARRLADKMQRAKQLYDHNKRTLNDVAWSKSFLDSEQRVEH